MGSHKVHFLTTDNIGSHGEGRDIAIAQVEDGELQVHMGYIQAYHQYRIMFLVGKGELDKFSEAMSECEVESECCRLVSAVIVPDDGALQATAEIFAHKQRIFREKLVLHVPSVDKMIKIFVIASVFGKYDGTPTLSPGVKCIGHREEDGDSSDVSV